MSYTEEFNRAYEDLQKAIRDRSHLVPKIITDKNGHQRKVMVRPDEQKSNKKITVSKIDEEVRETYADVLEWLNPYDRTDEHEVEKYREAFESLSKRYTKQRVAADYKSMKSKMNSRENFSNLINSIKDIQDDRSYDYQILDNAIKNTKHENLGRILNKIENLDGSIDKQKLVDALFPPEPPKKESASGNDIDKLIFSVKENEIKNVMKKYIADNPSKKDSIMDYIAKKHDEVLDKYRDAQLYYNEAETLEEEKKYKKIMDKYDKLTTIYGKAHYYDF